MSIYRVEADGALVGEFTFEEITAMLRSGNLPRSATYWHEGARQWRPVAPLAPAVRVPARPSHAAEPPAKPTISRVLDAVVLVVFFGFIGTGVWKYRNGEEESCYQLIGVAIMATIALGLISILFRAIATRR